MYCVMRASVPSRPMYYARMAGMARPAHDKRILNERRGDVYSRASRTRYLR